MEVDFYVRWIVRFFGRFNKRLLFKFTKTDVTCTITRILTGDHGRRRLTLLRRRLRSRGGLTSARLGRLGLRLRGRRGRLSRLSLRESALTRRRGRSRNHLVTTVRGLHCFRTVRGRGRFLARRLRFSHRTGSGMRTRLQRRRTHRRRRHGSDRRGLRVLRHTRLHLGRRFRGLTGRLFRRGAGAISRRGGIDLRNLLSPLGRRLRKFGERIGSDFNFRTGRHRALIRRVHDLRRLGRQVARRTMGLAGTLGNSGGRRNG